MEHDARGRSAASAIAPPPVLMNLADPAERSPNPQTCPFFRSIGAGGALMPPIEVPDPANRCLAVAEAKPQSIRQQQLVCLTDGHVNCPRYLRGALVSSQVTRHRLPRPTASPPVIASVLVLILSAAASVGFLLANGGMALALPSSGPGGVAAGSPSPSVPPEASVVPQPSNASPSPADPSPTRPVTAPPASPEPTIAPSPPPSPTPGATPGPTPAPTPAATSDRYAVLEPCPGAPDCWIYTVRPGDNFQSIVNWFGVPFDTVVAMNPQLGDVATIHAGDRIRVPPPTR